MTEESASNSAQSAAEAAIEAQQNDPSWEPIAVSEEDELLCYRDYSSGLNERKTEDKDFTYPIDMSGRAPRIVFEAQIIEGKSLDINGALEFARRIGKQVVDAVTGDGDKKEDAKTSDETEVVTAKEQNDVNLEERPVYEVPSGTPDGSVSLYLPQSIVFGDNMIYNKANLGIIGGAAERYGGGASGEQSLSIDANGNLSPQAEALVTRFATQAGAAGVSAIVGKVLGGGGFGATIAAAVGGSAVTDAASSVTRTTSNPNIRQLFQSVTPRTFRFSFRLVAQSHDEAEEIKDIIRFFRLQAYPETIRFDGIPFGYKFPNIFVIKMYNGSEEIEGAKILPSYLESITTTYNPSAMGLHDDGNWTDVDIQLSFLEVTSLDKQRINEGY